MTNEYRLLGRTGLRVSRLALGAMTFGAQQFGGHDWGADDRTARAVFDRYLETGGNFIDTSNSYTGGRSEELLGKFIAERGTRDKVVLASKFTSVTRVLDPNLVGNGRKNMLASIEASLRALGTDYLDLYWMHMWDGVTPAEEVMSTFDALVRSGKVRAVGLSNVPAWYLTQAQLLSRGRGWEPVAALQLEYSLVQREIEREHVAAAGELGMGIVPWSPLAFGLLSGKYRRDDGGIAGEGRIDALKSLSFYRQPGDREWAVVDAVREVAEELGRTPAQVALNWVANRPGVVSTLVGARTREQLDENLASLDFSLTEEQESRLTKVSQPDLGPLHEFYNIIEQRLDFSVTK